MNWCACGKPVVVWWQHLGQRRTGYCSSCVNGLRDIAAIRYEFDYEGETQ